MDRFGMKLGWARNAAEYSRIHIGTIRMTASGRIAAGSALRIRPLAMRAQRPA